MDYNSITGSAAGSLQSWVNHTAVGAESANIVAESESIIYRRLRHWQMLTSTTGTMTTSQATLSVPGDFLEDKIFRITGTAATDIVRKTIQEVIQAWQYDGSGNRVVSQPKIFSNDKASLLLDSPCDQAYPFLFEYYQQPTALGTANTTNFLTTTYPRLLRTTCMAQACEYMKDAGQGNFDRTYWAEMAQAELDAAQKESDMHERSAELGMILK